MRQRRKKMFDELIFNRLTDEQRAFVEDFENSILVSASAGTGKTTTMIRKILHLLLIEKVDITNLLVVTYTTAAASKMKHDLYMGLQKALDCVGDDEGLVSHINKQIDLLNNSDIGTIHAFCNKIIKKYFYQIGIDPNYSILSNEKSKSYLINNAMNDIFEKNNQENFDEFFKLYENFNSDRTDNALRNCILTLYDYLICRESSDSWAQDTLVESYRESNNVVWEYLLQYYKNKWQELLWDLNNTFDACAGFGHDKSKAFCVCRIDYANKVLECKNVFDLAKVVRVEKVPSKPSINVEKDPTLIGLDEIVENMSNSFKELKSETAKVFEIFEDEKFLENNQINKNNAIALFNLCTQLKSRYDEIKKENNLLDFNDLEHLAMKLCEDKAVVAELKNDYKYIFVDEYQDVNQIQESVISKICKSNNLYMIGDVKQSIYRFRQSSPEIFLAKYNDYKNGLNDKRLILFNKNFRSDSNVLEFVNNVFDEAITPYCVGIDYRNEARLVSGLGLNTESKSVHISLLDAEEIKESNKELIDDTKEETTKREYEARLIATKIAEIVDKGVYTFKDIAILTRDKKDLAKNIWIALKKYNIPVSLMVKGNIFKSNEIIVLLSLLRCVYNEADDISFATLLKSPIVGLTDNELAEIRLTSVESETFYQACIVAEESIAGIGAKITYLRQILRNFRLEILSRSIGETLREFVMKHNLDIYYKGMPDGIEKECYINEFLNIVDSQIYENSLGRLLDYIDVIQEKESEIVISGGNDSVTLMTMHSSKGLDFPVVIVSGVGDAILKNASKDICINKDFGFAVSGVQENAYLRMDNINAVAINLKNRKEEFEESIRLLYVALTRPKKELYITGVYEPKSIKKQPIFKCKTYLDVILEGVSGANLNYFVNKKQSFEIKENNANICCEIPSINDLGGIIDETQIILDVSDPNLVNMLKKYHSIQPIDLSKIAFKNSVTSILREQEVDYANILTNFKRMEVKESLDSDTAMELGTQYHTIMQYIEYGKEQDIKKLIDSLVFANKINPIYLNNIDIDKIVQAKKVVEKLVTESGVVEKEKNFLTLSPHCALISGSNVEEKVLVQGVIDLSIANPDGAIIVDFKTNKTKDKQYLIDCYATQLNLYAKSYELAYNKKVVHKYLYSFEMGELIEIV